MSEGLSLGAICRKGGRCCFTVWAPFIRQVQVRIIGSERRIVSLDRDESGYHVGTIEGIRPGTRYVYVLDGEKERPDPASRYQPEGVHGPSQIIDSSFAWKDEAWSGTQLTDYIIYELHAGTFTPEGDFDAVIPHLDDLKELGITAIELMPVAQFPGTRNWGYDGTYPFAVQNSYGGPEGLKRLVNACHMRGLAVVLDVVYNHLGPEGNYIGNYAPYFTDRYKTPWGEAVNFDGPYSDEVRRFFIQSAIHWIRDFHIDALRIDAIHAILDFSAHPFLAELAIAVKREAERLGRKVYLIPESDLNDTRAIRPRENGGFALDAQWNDDFHHSLHTLLTGERRGYYQDFGLVEHLATALREGFVFSGQYSRYRKRRFGDSSRDIPAHRFVVCAQNHDQVGNRMLGERLSQLVSYEQLKLAASVVLLSPNIPLLFMGEEYGETAPFQYFVSHGDPELIAAVRRGRREEFASFEWQGEPPDPQDESTFKRSMLNLALKDREQHGNLREFYKALISTRKSVAALSLLSKENMQVRGYEEKKVLLLHRWSESDEAVAAFNFSETDVSMTIPIPKGSWKKLIDSADTRWLGRGSLASSEIESAGEIALSLSPHSVLLFSKRKKR